ncbi:MAG TPA: trigger factor [bacterium]|nr:trigger factor [bacterium]
MDITIEKLEKSQIKLTVTIPVAVASEEKKKAFAKLKSQLKIQGFRKGKIPESMARELIPAEEVTSEMLQACVPEWYFEALQQEGIRAISQPKFEITSVEDDKPVVFTAQTNVYPEITLGDYRSIKIKHSHPKVTDKDVNESLDLLRQRSATYEAQDKAAAKDDVIVLTTKAKMGEEELKAFTRENYQHYIGENFFAPGFDDEVIGLKKGDTKEFSLTFPKEYPLERYRNNKVDFAITVVEVKIRVLPVLDDAFAKTIGAKSLADLKQELEHSLQHSKEHEAEQQFQKDFFAALIKQTKMDTPAVLIDDELDKIQKEFEWRLNQQGLNLETYLSAQNKKLEELQKNWLPQAEEVAKLELILDEIAKTEKIAVKPAELDSEFHQWLSSFRDQKGHLTDEGRNLQRNLSTPNGRLYLTQLIRRNKTRQFLLNLGHDHTSHQETEEKKSKIPAKK